MTSKIAKILIIPTIFYSLLLSQNTLAAKAIISKLDPFFAPEVAFFDENNKKRYFDEYEGKTVLLVFWATWCGTCTKEMQSLDTLAKDFRKLPFELVAISQDYQGIKTVLDFLEREELRFVKPYHDYRNAMFRDMEVVGLPSAFIISPDGKVIMSLKGEVQWHEEKTRLLLLNHIAGNPEMPKNTYKQESVSFQKTKKLENNQQLTNNSKEESQETKEKDDQN